MYLKKADGQGKQCPTQKHLSASQLLSRFNPYKASERQQQVEERRLRVQKWGSGMSFIKDVNLIQLRSCT